MNNKKMNFEDKSHGLSKRIVSIQQGEENIDALILEYIPFIKSSVSKATGKHIDESSDEISVGLMAFSEAVRSFDAEKGSFLTFASWVIRRRIIDYQRKTSKILETNFSDLSQGQVNRLLNTSSIENTMMDSPLKLEIDALTQVLMKYDIDFEDLVLVSPKAQKTKNMCIKVIKYILDNPAIITKMRQHRRLPIKSFKENLNVPRKFMDRHRKYIIAVVEILRGDYVYLKEYVAFIDKG